MILDFQGAKIDYFKALYEEARNAIAEESAMMTKRMEQYLGSPEIDGSPVPATAVRNITYELIESQVSGYIPTPVVSAKSVSESSTRNARAIENLCRRVRNDLPFERMNDMDERYSPIYGGSVWLVEWDDSITSHGVVGDVKVTCLPPTAFIPQPNVYDIAEMEYCFVRFETTREDLMRRYGVSVSNLDETESDEDDDKTATLYVCYYKSEDDKICLYAWSGDVECADVDDYYARKRKVCRKCGEREGVCTCDKPKWETTSSEYEEVTEPIQLTDGHYIYPTEPVINNGIVEADKAIRQVGNGQEMAFDTTGGIVTPHVEVQEIPHMQPTRLPYYAPKTFPIVIRKNTSREREVFGQSDCDVIRPQQQQINKLETKIQEKLLRASVMPVLPEDATVVPTSDVFGQVIRLREGQSASQYGLVDTTPNISADVMQAERLYDQAKRILGISDTFMGQADTTAQSGKAKQVQVAQSQGRLSSKRLMKNAAYADLDRIIFEFNLAYADEPRPAVYKDADGRLHNVEFNRYDFLVRDVLTGEWFYDDRYMFACDAAIDLEESRASRWEEALKALQIGAYGNPADPRTLLIYWRNLEAAHYPNARENVERFEALVAQAEQQAQMQMQMQPKEVAQ